MRICIIGTLGGHLGELLMLRDFWNKHDTFILTNRTGRKFPYPHFCVDIVPFTLPIIAKCFVQTWKILVRERPKVIVSTGAEIAVPAFILSKLLGIRSVFIETVTRFDNPTRAGRLLYWFSNIFLVQHEAMLERYGKKAQYQGRVF